MRSAFISRLDTKLSRLDLDEWAECQDADISSLVHVNRYGDIYLEEEPAAEYSAPGGGSEYIPHYSPHIRRRPSQAELDRREALASRLRDAEERTRERQRQAAREADELKNALIRAERWSENRRAVEAVLDGFRYAQAEFTILPGEDITMRAQYDLETAHGRQAFGADTNRYEWRLVDWSLNGFASAEDCWVRKT